MAVGDTYTSDQGPLQDRITNLQGQITSQIQGAPAARQNMGEQLMASEGSITPLAQDRGKMIEMMFNADKDLAQKYTTQGSQYQIENPMAREAAISGAENTMWGAVASLNTQIGARKAVLGDVVDRGMKIYEAGLQSKQMELDNLYRQMELNDRAAQRAQDMEWKRQQADTEQMRWETETGLKYGSGQKLSSGAQSKLNDWDAAERQLDEVIKLYGEMKKKGVDVGPIQGNVTRLIGGYSDIARNPDLDRLDQAVSTLQLMIEKPLIGTQQSVAEMAKVARFVPNITEVGGRFQSKLSNLSGYIGKQKLAIQSGGGTMDTSSYAKENYPVEDITGGY